MKFKPKHSIVQYFCGDLKFCYVSHVYWQNTILERQWKTKFKNEMGRNIAIHCCFPYGPMKVWFCCKCTFSTMYTTFNFSWQNETLDMEHILNVKPFVNLSSLASYFGEPISLWLFNFLPWGQGDNGYYLELCAVCGSRKCPYFCQRRDWKFLEQRGVS